jgi:hypothetical protein
MADPFQFYVGVGAVNWLYDRPNRHRLFISIRRINKIKKLKPATTAWCCDSGGFTELSLHGQWVTTPAEYVENLRRASEMGRLVWASPQDWMCEPEMIKKTGLTVEKHQRLTCENFQTLTQLAPELPIIPVLQGWNPADYYQHFAMYEKNGVKLQQHQAVGLGSFCRRAKINGVRELVIDMKQEGLKLHGFGLKKDGLELFGNHLTSSDSMAWSYRARMAGRQGIYLCGKSHRARNCAHCYEWAMKWADHVANINQTAAPLLWEENND